MDEHGNTGQDRHLALVAVTSSRALMPGALAGTWAQQDRRPPWRLWLHSLLWHR